MILATFRAMVTYRPVHIGAIVWAERYLDKLTFEGIHFSQQKPQLYAIQSRSALRLVNCSFGEPDLVSWGVYVHGPLEIVNCLIPRRVAALNSDAHPNAQLTMRNSLVGGCDVSYDRTGDHAVNLEHCLVWAPLESALTSGANLKTLRSTVRQSLLLADSVTSHMIPLPGDYTWEGSGNVYRLGSHTWGFNVPGPYIVSLAELRQHLKSDTDSVEDDALEFAPEMWRLLPGSPGYQEAPDGKDLGADIDLVLQTQPLSSGP